jgi:hypothetical protein
MKLDLFDKSTSSPASASGVSPPVSPEFLTMRPYGQDLALASLSPRQAKERDLLTSGTFGPHSTISSNSAALTSSLASRLREHVEMLGSTLFKLTWKQRTMPSGRSKPSLAASGRRTSDPVTIGWPTPCAMEPGTSPEQVWARKQRLTETTGIYRGNDCGLGSKVHLASWPTATARDGKDGSFCPNVPLNSLLGREVWLAAWATPIVNDAGGSTHCYGKFRKDGTRPNHLKLPGEAKLTIDGPARLTVSGEMLTGCDAATKSGGQLSPAHSLWLMLGPFATAWASSGERVTRSRSAKRSASSAPLSPPPIPKGSQHDQ